MPSGSCVYGETSPPRRVDRAGLVELERPAELRAERRRARLGRRRAAAMPVGRLREQREIAALEAGAPRRAQRGLVAFVEARRHRIRRRPCSTLRRSGDPAATTAGAALPRAQIARGTASCPPSRLARRDCGVPTIAGLCATSRGAARVALDAPAAAVGEVGCSNAAARSASGAWRAIRARQRRAAAGRHRARSSSRRLAVDRQAIGARTERLARRCRRRVPPPSAQPPGAQQVDRDRVPSCAAQPNAGRAAGPPRTPPRSARRSSRPARRRGCG